MTTSKGSLLAECANPQRGFRCLNFVRMNRGCFHATRGMFGPIKPIWLVCRSNNSNSNTCMICIGHTRKGAIKPDTTLGLLSHPRVPPFPYLSSSALVRFRARSTVMQESGEEGVSRESTTSCAKTTAKNIHSMRGRGRGRGRLCQPTDGGEEDQG